MDYQINFAKTNNYVETIFGRRCNIKGINDKNFVIRGFAERQSINAPIQGTAADIIKLAMIEIHQNIISNKIRCSNFSLYEKTFLPSFHTTPIL